MTRFLAEAVVPLNNTESARAKVLTEIEQFCTSGKATSGAVYFVGEATFVEMLADPDEAVFEVIVEMPCVDEFQRFLDFTYGADRSPCAMDFIAS